MTASHFKDHESVLCSRLLGTVCHLDCLNVRVPIWTLFVFVQRKWLEGRVSAYPAGRFCVHMWRLVDLCCSGAVVVKG